MIDQTGDPPNTKQEDTSRYSTRQTILISIIASIIASFIFVTFLQPIFGLISDTVVTIIGVFYHGYIDTLYEQASIGITNAMIFLILSTVLIFMFACML
jgi:predicted permease